MVLLRSIQSSTSRSFQRRVRLNTSQDRLRGVPEDQIPPHRIPGLCKQMAQLMQITGDNIKEPDALLIKLRRSILRYAAQQVVISQQLRQEISTVVDGEDFIAKEAVLSKSTRLLEPMPPFRTMLPEPLVAGDYSLAAIDALLCCAALRSERTGLPCPQKLIVQQGLGISRSLLSSQWQRDPFNGLSAEGVQTLSGANLATTQLPEIGLLHTPFLSSLSDTAFLGRMMPTRVASDGVTQQQYAQIMAMSSGDSHVVSEPNAVLAVPSEVALLHRNTTRQWMIRRPEHPQQRRISLSLRDRLAGIESRTDDVSEILANLQTAFRAYWGIVPFGPAENAPLALGVASDDEPGFAKATAQLASPLHDVPQLDEATASVQISWLRSCAQREDWLATAVFIAAIPVLSAPAASLAQLIGASPAMTNLHGGAATVVSTAATWTIAAAAGGPIHRIILVQPAEGTIAPILPPQQQVRIIPALALRYACPGTRFRDVSPLSMQLSHSTVALYGRWLSSIPHGFGFRCIPNTNDHGMAQRLVKLVRPSWLLLCLSPCPAVQVSQGILQALAHTIAHDPYLRSLVLDARLAGAMIIDEVPAVDQPECDTFGFAVPGPDDKPAPDAAEATEAAVPDELIERQESDKQLSQFMESAWILPGANTDTTAWFPVLESLDCATLAASTEVQRYEENDLHLIEKLASRLRTLALPPFLPLSFLRIALRGLSVASNLTSLCIPIATRRHADVVAHSVCYLQNGCPGLTALWLDWPTPVEIRIKRERHQCQRPFELACVQALRRLPGLTQLYIPTLGQHIVDELNDNGQRALRACGSSINTKRPQPAAEAVHRLARKERCLDSLILYTATTADVEAVERQRVRTIQVCNPISCQAVPNLCMPCLSQTVTSAASNEDLLAFSRRAELDDGKLPTHPLPPLRSFLQYTHTV